MTKKHYTAIAEIFKDRLETLQARAVGESYEPNHKRMAEHWHIVGKLADYFASDNPKFDPERFLSACEGAE